MPAIKNEPYTPTIIWFEVQEPTRVQFEKRKDAVTYGRTIATPGNPTPVWQITFHRNTGRLSGAIIAKAHATTTED